jgi:predicted DCC family thiol-disulfide oxidoreductase YuxK
MITILFDGKCSLCAKEIKYYQKIAPKGIFKWCDVTIDHSILDQYNLSQSQALLYLHAKDDNGDMHIGVDAFIIIWSKLQKFKILAKIISFPVIYQIAKIIYRIFAKIRFNNLDHCKISLNCDKK